MTAHDHHHDDADDAIEIHVSKERAGAEPECKSLEIKPPPRLILASTSRYRLALLQRLDISFDVQAPGCDEKHEPGLSPEQLARFLAARKAKSVQQMGALTIGSDQLVEVDGEILGKPGNVERALAQLEKLSGRAHRLITAVAVYSADNGRLEVDCDVHTLHMRTLNRAALNAYIAHDLPFDCAGSYKFEQRGIALFERIEADPSTADDTAILGLPLLKLCALLRRFGVDVIEKRR